MLRAATLKNQPLFKGKHVFSTHIQELNPMMPPKKKTGL